jgi:hypothetical protein
VKELTDADIAFPTSLCVLKRYMYALACGRFLRLSYVMEKYKFSPMHSNLPRAQRNYFD